MAVRPRLKVLLGLKQLRDEALRRRPLLSQRKRSGEAADGEEVDDGDDREDQDGEVQMKDGEESV